LAQKDKDKDKEYIVDILVPVFDLSKSSEGMEVERGVHSSPERGLGRGYAPSPENFGLAVLARGILSVCPSVRYTLVWCPDE